MYSNAGKSIKSYVSVMVAIGYVISIILGFAILGFGAEYESAGIVILGIVVSVVGCVIAWLSGLMLYAYGEIADRLISIDEKISSNNLTVEESALNTTPETQGDFQSKNCDRKKETGNIPADSWKCTCGRVNASYVSTCPCGINRREIQK